jgi:cytochrome c oxidase subunit 5b
MQFSVFRRVTLMNVTPFNYLNVFITSPLCRSAVHHKAASHQDTSTPTLGKAGEIPTDLEQSTGLEREQYLLRREGKTAFDMGVKRDFYGTRERPAYVPSMYESRIVICSGFPTESHEYKFFELEKDHPQRCPECGQYFVLQSHGDSGSHHH